MNFLFKKWRLAFKVLPFLGVIVILKFAIHYWGLEFLTLNALFTAIISANIFLIGFLISGVLVDYKESERLPGELAVSLEVFADECEMVYKTKKDKIAIEMMHYMGNLTQAVIDWFYKKEKTTALFKKIEELNHYFLALEPLIQANFIVRLKNEQSQLRKIITRIHTIRETSFNPAGYAIAEIITFILVIGLIFIKMDPYYESVFFVSFVSFILIYMVELIKDLDNPFAYYEKVKYTDEVSLKPLMDLKKRIEKIDN
jgi:hypothetical protein